jgi:signal transduction histidine kinase
MGEQSIESGPSGRSAQLRSRPGDDALAGDASIALWLATLLAFSFGLQASVNQMPAVDRAELLLSFATSTISTFCGVAPSIAFLFVLERRLPTAGRRRWVALAGSVLAATALASSLQVAAGAAIGDDELIRMNASGWRLVIGNQLVWLVLIAGWREALWRGRATLAALHESEVRRVALQARLAEAELQMLQAQVEPHFLFNSLANVRRLGRLDAAAGKAMLADLLQYLQQTLPRLREADSTLAREAEVARAYLAIHKIRMGRRLDVEFAIPSDLGATPVPPMMLLTLIENALKHGLAPLPEGGSIRVAAENDGGAAVRLSVADTGRGIVPGRGGGTGLANVRARLRTLHGAKASLSLETNVPRGVIASIVLPRA